MDKSAYTTKIEDNPKFVYLPRSERNAKFGYNELSEMPTVAFKRFRIKRRLKTWN